VAGTFNFRFMDALPSGGKQERGVTMEEAMLTPWNMQNILTDALELYADQAGTAIKTRTYDEAGMPTRDKGLVVEVEGSTFQITIVQSK
jgi:hypothetical protein